jgi:LPXTG-site transpeptidase (sortase) family protein
MWVAAISIHALTYQAEPHARLARFSTSSGNLALAGSRDDGRAASEGNVPIGRLEIPRIGLSAVVMEGDDEQTLNVAVGHLPDTPLPWQEGNAALAGHRDTFFRPLRRLQDGDEIRLVTPHGTFRYRATRQVVVEPNELWVLDPSPAAALTLVTCYPFDFVGTAPRRFVVHAERIVETSEAPETSTHQAGNGVP